MHTDERDDDILQPVDQKERLDVVETLSDIHLLEEIFKDYDDEVRCFDVGD